MFSKNKCATLMDLYLPIVGYYLVVPPFAEVSYLGCVSSNFAHLEKYKCKGKL